MHYSYTVDLNIRLIIVMVFFVALAFGSKRGWISVRELVISGTALVIAAAGLLYDVTLKAAIEQYGHNTKAFQMAGVTILPFLLALGFAIWFMVRKMKSDPPVVNRPKLKSGAKPRGKTLAKPAKAANASAATEGPKPKPQRTRGGKRRF